MTNPMSSEAKELIALAERMGIPVEVAVPVVLKHLTDKEQSDDVVDPRRLVRRLTA
jgi:hypothetical protein